MAVYGHPRKDFSESTTMKVARAVIYCIGLLVFAYSVLLSSSPASWERRGLETEVLHGSLSALPQPETANRLSQKLARSSQLQGPKVSGDNQTQPLTEAPRVVPLPKEEHFPSAEGGPTSALAISKGVECGAVWQTRYAKFHHATMAKGEDLFEDPEQRFVIFDCSDEEQVKDNCGGLGDILVGIVSTFAFALLSNRTFLVRATMIENAFESRAIDWKLPRDLKTQVPAISRKDKRTVQHYALNARVNATSIHAIGLEQDASAKVLVEALKDKASVIVHRGHRGIIHELLHRHSAVSLQMHALGLHSPSQAFTCLMRYIIQPTPLVISAIRGYLEIIRSPNTFVVGIHIRTGDASMVSHRKGGKVLLRKHGRMFECAETLSKNVAPTEKKKVMWFLTSDSPQLKAEAREIYRDRVMVTDFMPMHLSHRYNSQKEMEEAIKSIVGEWILFSECDVHIFRESGWSTTASLLSLHSDKAAVFPRIKGKWYTEDLETLCTPDRLIPLDHKADMWSGI